MGWCQMTTCICMQRVHPLQPPDFCRPFLGRRVTLSVAALRPYSRRSSASTRSSRNLVVCGGRSSSSSLHIPSKAVTTCSNPHRGNRPRGFRRRVHGDFPAPCARAMPRHSNFEHGSLAGQGPGLSETASGFSFPRPLRYQQKPSWGKHTPRRKRAMWPWCCHHHGLMLMMVVAHGLKKFMAAKKHSGTK